MQSFTYLHSSSLPSQVVEKVETGLLVLASTRPQQLGDQSSAGGEASLAGALHGYWRLRRLPVDACSVVKLQGLTLDETRDLIELMNPVRPLRQGYRLPLCCTKNKLMKPVRLLGERFPDY